MGNGDYYQRYILPYLFDVKSKTDELWLIGQGSQSLVFHSVFASALLETVAGAGSYDPSNCIIVPDAPLEALQDFCQLLHTGRSEFDYTL